MVYTATLRRSATHFLPETTKLREDLKVGMHWALLFPERRRAAVRKSKTYVRDSLCCALVLFAGTNYLFCTTSEVGKFNQDISTSGISSDLNTVFSTVLDEQLRNTSFCERRARAVPREIESTTAASLRTDIDYVRVIDHFTALRPLDIVISFCEGIVSWIDQLNCRDTLHIYIYLKCAHTAQEMDQYLLSPCVTLVALYIVNVTGGPEATVRHFIHENYDSLNMTCFVKDRDQLGSRVQKFPTGPLRRIALGLLALGDRGGFVHIAQDPVRVGGSSLSDISTLFWGYSYFHRASSKYHRCGVKHGFRECKRHWWFKLMDTRNNVDWFSRALTIRTGVRHFKRDSHFYSVLQPFRKGELLDTGGFARDAQGFPSLEDRANLKEFCALYTLLTCLPCSNPWIPGRTQFIVSSQRMRSVPKEVYAETSKQLLYEYTWGLLFNCFEPFDAHVEGAHFFIRCEDE